MKSFFQNYIQVVAGARLCLEKRLQMPTLVLIYTLIDTFAWATSDKNKPVRNCFEEWVTRWVLKDGNFLCTATELYAARCAVLHTLTSKADLTRAGKAREVTYAWGTASTSDLQTATVALGFDTHVAVHIDELLEAVCEGMAAVVERSSTDPQLAERLNEAGALHFTGMEMGTVAKFLERVHGVA